MRRTLRQLNAGQPRHQNYPNLEKKTRRALSSADGCNIVGALSFHSSLWSSRVHSSMAKKQQGLHRLQIACSSLFCCERTILPLIVNPGALSARTNTCRLIRSLIIKNSAHCFRLLVATTWTTVTIFAIFHLSKAAQRGEKTLLSLVFLMSRILPIRL